MPANEPVAKAKFSLKENFSWKSKWKNFNR